MNISLFFPSHYLKTVLFLSLLLNLFLMTSCQINPIKSENKTNIASNDKKNQLIYPIVDLSKISLNINEETFFQNVLENHFTLQPGKLKLTIGELIVVPTKTFQHKGKHCREYKTTMKKNLSEISINAIACRRTDKAFWLRLP